MRMLDLFCGEGLAAEGYWQSGKFHEIVGVDNDPERLARYSFDKHPGDCLSLDYEFLMGFDFIHASPPCQAYSKRTPHPELHPRLIAATHLMLIASGRPYCIENVEGSSRELRPNLVICGTAMGLLSQRVRYFHLSTLAVPERLMRTRKAAYEQGEMTRDEAIKAMGLADMPYQRLKKITRKGIEQGVPPAMTRLIAEMMFPGVKAMIG